MSRHTLFTSLPAAAAAVLLAACSAPGHSQPVAVHASADPVQVAHQFVQCARAHDQPDFPEPTWDAQGRPHLPPGVEPSSQVRQACGSILNALPPQDRGGSSTPPDPAQMRLFAQCMRAHGIQDWPDPDAQGTFHFPPDLQDFKHSPRFQQIHAAKTGPCARYDPSGDISSAP